MIFTRRTPRTSYHRATPQIVSAAGAHPGPFDEPEYPISTRLSCTQSVIYLAVSPTSQRPRCRLRQIHERAFLGRLGYENARAAPATKSIRTPLT